MTILPRASAILLAAGLCLTAESFSPSDVKIIGDLDYGATSDPVEYTPTPRYRAFVFNGNGGDQIEVTAKGEGRTAFVAIADGGLNQLASGTTQLKFTLPKHGPDLETFYIVFRDSEDKPARFTVTLKKAEQGQFGLGPIRRPARTALASWSGITPPPGASHP